MYRYMELHGTCTSYMYDMHSISLIPRLTSAHVLRVYFIGPGDEASTACAKGYAIGCISVCKISAIWHLAGQKNVQKSTHAAFLSHLNIGNVPVNCQFTPGRALLPFLCSFLCSFLVCVPTCGHRARHRVRRVMRYVILVCHVSSSGSASVEPGSQYDVRASIASQALG